MTLHDLPGAENLPLVAVRNRFARWLFEDALPFWASTGCDGTASNPAALGAQECLTLQGAPAQPPFKRVRVQARQLFVFSWAALKGWQPAAQRAESIFRFLLNAHRPDGGWVKLLARDGAVLDDSADLYDIAFVLFALAWYGRVDSTGQAVELARQTLAWLGQTMALPNGGFMNTRPANNAWRQQNPHMHLLEAVLALHETTGDAADLAQAHALYALFSQHFMDERTGTLGEYFGPDWQPAAGPEGQWCEPGHHFEWVWLLQAYARQSGVDTAAQAARLYHFAHQYGVDAQTALVRDAVARNGQILKPTFRLWVQGEALRGALCHDPQDKVGWATRMASNLLDRYFTGCPTGTWVDQLDAQGAPAASQIPTSSLYHIVTAYDALDQAARACVPSA